ncbi:hypothetical protein AB4090_04700 [Acidithiobacillus sp. IBUN Pt1247-S3]|uniref:hypothetical protein n=1 Tax=Acidithiobacillus sp. IBUN Pt1247-S3 TaxID=3166642 RepID=UPI0034E5C62C
MADSRMSREAGMALLPTLLLTVVLAVFLLIFLGQQYGASQSIDHHAVHQLEILALDQGGENAANTLNGYSDWPEILAASNPTALAPAYQPLPAGQFPVMPSTDFWQTCAAQQQCATYTVTENGIPFSGYYVMYPGNGLAEKLSGYEDQQDQVGPTSRQYVAFVAVTNPENSSMVVKEFVLRKSLL